VIGATALFDAATELEHHARDCASGAGQIDAALVDILRRRSGTALGAIDAEIARAEQPDGRRA
jgi:hypothetical protein